MLTCRLVLYFANSLIIFLPCILPGPRDEILLPSLPKFDAPDRALVGKWKIYLKWEEGNPLEIEEKEKATLINRVMGVYRKAVVRMRYYTEIW
jgi:cleavage stimulation factor subunit 3